MPIRLSTCNSLWTHTAQVQGFHSEECYKQLMPNWSGIPKAYIQPPIKKNEDLCKSYPMFSIWEATDKKFSFTQK